MFDLYDKMLEGKVKWQGFCSQVTCEGCECKLGGGGGEETQLVGPPLLVRCCGWQAAASPGASAITCRRS